MPPVSWKKRKKKRLSKVGRLYTYAGNTHKTSLKELSYLGLLLLWSQHTNPRPCLPGNHSEDIGFVGKGLFQPRTLGLNPRWLAAFGYSHFEGTVWDGHIIVCHLHYMEACSKQQTKTYRTGVAQLWEITLYSRVLFHIHSCFTMLFETVILV